MARFSPGDVVVVLGAGATRGASFVRPGYAECLPPLNLDFFTQLQRVRRQKHVDVVEGVMNDVVELFGPNFSLSLEDYFTNLESMQQAVERSDRKDRAFTPRSIRDKRKRLLDALAAVLEESTDVTRRDQKTRQYPKPCKFHRDIVRALGPRDTIITFNYDCVVDHALRIEGKEKWSAKYGYGFPGPSRVHGHSFWSAASPPEGQNKSINLLKLHGSINWFPLPSDGKAPIRLRQRTYRQNGSCRYEIVPPEASKSIDERPALRQIWRYAEHAVRKARILAFIGFSFTPGDLHAESMFRVALSGNTTLESLIIANPDQDHRRKIRSVLSRQLQNRDTRVVQYDKLRDLAAYLPEPLQI